MPSKSCSSGLRPVTRGRDVLILNLSTGHPKRIATHFYEHMKHQWYIFCTNMLAHVILTMYDLTVFSSF